MLGPALESLPKLTGQFDMVFVDANKSEYMRYVKLMLERDLLAPVATIICDHVLFRGLLALNLDQSWPKHRLCLDGLGPLAFLILEI